MTSILFVQRAICTAVAVSMLLPLGGCQTPGPLQPESSQAPGAPPLSQAELQMRADSKRFNDTVMAAVLTGAATGALLGALGAAAAGGNSKQIRNTAIAGAVAGGVLVGVDGYVTAKKEQSGRNEIRTLQAVAADVRTENQKLQAFIDSADGVIAAGKQRLAALRGDVAAKRMTAQQADDARKREEQNIASMNNALANAKKNRDQYTQASDKFGGSPQNRRDLDAEIARMNKQVAQLEGSITEYNRALAVSKA